MSARELIGAGLELVPPRVLELAGPVDWRVGWDGGPSWGGKLREHEVERYRRDRTCFYTPLGAQRHLPRTWRAPAITMTPELWWGVTTVLHELAHALYFQLFWRHAKRLRVYVEPDGTLMVKHWQSGLTPPMKSVSSYKPRDYIEQWAEAFAAWLAPAGAVHPHGADPRLLVADERGPGRVGPWGFRWGNRGLLAFFNDLAGWPPDRLPVALR